MPCPSGVDKQKWGEVRPKVKAQYPDYSDERIDKITAGVIHKQSNNPTPKQKQLYTCPECGGYRGEHKKGCVHYGQPSVYKKGNPDGKPDVYSASSDINIALNHLQKDVIPMLEHSLTDLKQKRLSGEASG